MTAAPDPQPPPPRLPLEDLPEPPESPLLSVPPYVLADPHPTPTHIGLSLRSTYLKSILCLLPMLLAGAVFYGYRGLMLAGLVLASTLAATSLWRLIGQRGRSLRFPHAAYMALLLACLLPAQLAAFDTPLPQAPWTLPIAAGFLLVFFYWLLGGIGSRLHPVALAALSLLLAFPDLTRPDSVLRRPHLLTGDLLRAASLDRSGAVEPFLALTDFPVDAEGIGTAAHAIRTAPPAETLTAFGRGYPAADGAWISLDSLLRDRLPPLEDLILGGTPTPLGLPALAVVLLSALLLRGLTGVRMRLALVAIAAAGLGLLCLPVPVLVTAEGPVHRWLAFLQTGVTWETLVTFALYQLAAGPLVFVACFLATDGASRPVHRTGRVIYAVLLGLLAAAAQLYLSVSAGALLALIVVSLLTPPLTRLLRPKPLLTPV